MATNKEMLKKLGIKPVADGFTRRWIQCKNKKCKKVYFHDYTARGIGNPFIWLPCHHDFGMRFHEAVTVITETQAAKLLSKQIKTGK